MIQRVTNTKGPRADKYINRGITVCERWRSSFGAFYADMGPRPSGHTLERVDNNGNYEPANCRWATPLEQVLNRGLNKNNLSGHKGVSWYKRHKLWSAQIYTNYKKVHLGYFNSLDEAIVARKAAERKYHFAGMV
jgi:hypothetical protein